MTRQLHSSLERLGVDRVDLYLTHDFDPDVAPQRVVETLEGLRGAGPDRARSASATTTPRQLRATLAAGPVDAIQNSYSLLVRADEAELLALCAREQVSYTAYSPLAGGWLTGKYRRGAALPAGSRMTQRPERLRGVRQRRVFDALERLEALARGARHLDGGPRARAGCSPDPRVAAIVVGPMRPGHLDPVREALAHPLGRGRARRSSRSVF